MPGSVTHIRAWLGNAAWLAAVLSVTIVQPLYLLPIEQLLPIVLLLVMLGLFLRKPLVREPERRAKAWVAAGDVIDVLLAATAVVTGAYVAANYQGIIFRQGAFTPTDMLVASIAVPLVLEAVRRSVGWPLTIVSMVFIAYAIFGRSLPGLLMHRGYPYERTANQLVLSYSGIYGIPLQIMVRYVILFMVFGALLQVSGAADFLVRFSQVVAGRFSGGLGKVAVVASALVGSISGSAAGNVATTGSVTIPAMKKGGYAPHFAASIEAVASTGGQIMPPIMGAAAFLMADYLGIPYIQVATAAIIPAAFYFLSAGIAIDLYARDKGLLGLPPSAIPRLIPTLRQGWHFILLIAFVYGLLIYGFSPTRTAFAGVIAAALLVLIVRPAWGETWKTLKSTAESAAILCAVTAGAGIVVGVVQLTGLGAQLASVLVDLSMGRVVVLLLLVMVASIILGMGMPTTVVYILLAALVAPALVGMGIEPIGAHFFFFYFGVLAAITPPVALASYAAASLAGSPPDKTGWTAFRMALPSFVVPFFFALNPALLMQGSFFEILHSGFTAAIGIWLFSIAVMGTFNGRMPWWGRLVLLAGSVLLMVGGWATDLAGLALGAIVLAPRWGKRPSVGGAAPATEGGAGERSGNEGMARNAGATVVPGAEPGPGTADPTVRN